MIEPSIGAAVLAALALASRVLLIGIFGAAAWHKLREGRRFLDVLAAYRVLPAALVAPAGGIALTLEAGVALGLAWPSTATLAAGLGASLLVVYAVAIAINLRRGRRHIDCGCSFGDRGQPISGALLWRNGLLVGACAISTALVDPGDLSWPTIALALAGGVGLLLAYRGLETLLANAPALARLQQGRA